MKRRDFLKTSVLATAALAGTPFAAETKKEKPLVRAYRALGKTGLKMSDISLGTGGLPSPSMVLRAIDRGINYMDTAPDYGSSEEYIGGAMKKIQRDKVIITTKFCTPYNYPNHLQLGRKKKDYIQALEDSLSRMKTDHVDFCFVHAIGESDKNMEKEKKRLLHEEMLSAVEELKKAGKMRFLGVSSHGPDNMEDLLLTAVRSGHFDLIMPAFNFMKFPRMPDVLKEANEKGIAVVAMKTLAGAKDMKIEGKGEEFEPAALKWTLSHGEISGLVISIKSISQLDLYLSASGQKFTAADQRILDRYARRFGKEYCRTGCNQCETSCPQGVAIASTLRFQMYFRDYGMEKKALQSYARLERKADKCRTCEPKSCSGACPFGLPVSALLRDAHEELSFTV
ncbi:MAG: aldo/keto reductase [Nitrospiraceae bacterium]|nr:MAG: aldo/keto reductase [Nitrospiraceae bacterium]